MLSFFDLHCDTLSRAFDGNYSIHSSPLHISLEKSRIFQSYGQIMAIWTNNLSNNAVGYRRYKKIIEYAKKQGIDFSNGSCMIKNTSLILSIEDLRIIENDLSRIDELYHNGVRLAIPFWSQENQFGGAWNTAIGLSTLGKNAIAYLLGLGIVVDISHSSRKSADEIINICAKHNKSPIASHSNAFSICNHERNLSDKHFLDIVSLGGVVGISLCPYHLSKSGFATIEDIIKHIDHYLSLGGENHICFGCDFDGVDSLPLGINNLYDTPKIYLRLHQFYGEAIANKIFYGNANSYINTTFS